MGLDLGGAGLRLLDIPISTCSASIRRVHSEASHTRTQFGRAFLNVALAARNKSGRQPWRSHLPALSRSVSRSLWAAKKTRDSSPEAYFKTAIFSLGMPMPSAANRATAFEFQAHGRTPDKDHAPHHEKKRMVAGDVVTANGLATNFGCARQKFARLTAEAVIEQRSDRRYSWGIRHLRSQLQRSARLAAGIERRPRIRSC
jgi:hypothetical protein